MLNSNVKLLQTITLPMEGAFNIEFLKNMKMALSLINQTGMLSR